MYHSLSLISTILVLIIFLVNVLSFLNNRKAKKNLFYREPSNEAGEPVSTTIEKQHDMKLSNGNLEVENNDYKILEHGGIQKLGSQNSLPDDIIMTTIPPTRAPGDFSNQTEWITTSATKRNLLDMPGFPEPVPKPDQLNFVVQETQEMGKGMFAIRDIKFGELIFAERPLTVTPLRFGFSRVNGPDGFTEEQGRIILKGMENTYEIMVEGRMKEEDRKAFKELHDSRTKEGRGFLTGVIHTNGYGIGNLDKSDSAITEGYYSVVVKHGSRINHSCVSNVTCTFSNTSFSLQFTAMRDIKAGEQLFYRYTGWDISAQDRRDKLAGYGIECKCVACVNATPESDRLRQELAQRIHYIEMLSDEWIRHPGNCLSEELLEPVFELKEAMERGRFETDPGFVRLSMVLFKVYMRMGLTAKAKPYGAKVDKVLGFPPMES